jgi:hypothetical protein
MKMSTSLLSLIAAASLATALPQALPPPPAGQTYYYFRTAVKSNQPTAYSNYYLKSWRTGAGSSDATFVQGAPASGQAGWFNGTYLNWFQQNNQKGEEFYGFKYGTGGAGDAKWSSVCLLL